MRTRARTPALGVGRSGVGRRRGADQYGGGGSLAQGLAVRLISSNRRPNASLLAERFCPPLPAPRDSKLSLKRL